MRSQHILLLLVAWSLAAAEVRLGPETPLSPSVVTAEPAAFTQSLPKVASNGRGHLAVWEDRREGMFGIIYAARLDFDGRPAEPFARRLGVGVTPVIAADASGSGGYVIAWLDGTAVRLLRVDEDGNTIETIQRSFNGVSTFICFGTPSALLALATNGTTYVLRSRTYCYGSEEQTILIDPARSGWQILGPFGWRFWSLKATGANYTLVATSYSTGREEIEWMTLDDAGQVVSSQSVMRPDAYAHIAAATDDRVLAAWSAPDSVSYTLVERNGSVVKPATAIPVPPGTLPAKVFWDGREFLLVVRASSMDSAFRIAADGTLLNAEPYVLSTRALEEPSFAANAGSRALVWTDRRFSAHGDVVSRVVPDFSALGQSMDSPALVSMSGRAQVGVQIATAGAHRMAVWCDGRPEEITGRIDGVDFRIASAPDGIVSQPALAAGERSFLVTWKDRPASAAKARLLARRYAFDRSPLDAEPLVLATDLELPRSDYFSKPFDSELGDRPGVASDGSSFLVVTGANPDGVRIVRVDAATGLSDAVTHRTARFGDPVVDIPRVRAARKTGNWLVPFIAANTSGITKFVAVELSPSLQGLREIPLFDEGNRWFSLAAAGDRIAYTWTSAGGLTFGQKTPEPWLVAEKRRIDSTTPVPRFALAWNGSEYVIAWTDNLYATSSSHERSRLLGMRLSPDGVPLDSAPFEIASSRVAGGFEPSIAATDFGVLIAYSKSDDTFGGAPRAYVRTLDRLALSGLPRRPAVRH